MKKINWKFENLVDAAFVVLIVGACVALAVVTLWR